MLSLGIRPGLIASHTIVINDALSYQIRLSKLRLGPDVYRLDIRATTTLGRLTVSHAHYHNFATASKPLIISATNLNRTKKYPTRSHLIMIGWYLVIIS